MSRADQRRRGPLGGRERRLHRREDPLGHLVVALQQFVPAAGSCRHSRPSTFDVGGSL